MLKLVPPGKRKNKYWIVRGSIDGHEIEKSLGVSLRQDAEKKLRELLREYESGRNVNENVTFASAADRYMQFRTIRRKDIHAIERLKTELGDKLVTEITPNDFIVAANKLYPTHMNSTKNRCVITPGAAILHYAARNKWCEHIVVCKFKTPTPKTRYVDFETEEALLNSTAGKKHLLILWLFRQGDRIGDILKLRYEDCDLERKTINRHISKSDRYVVQPIDSDICKILKAENIQEGFIFPWRTETMIRKWLKPLRIQLGIHFTPHMARHTLGKRLNDAGAGLRTIMQTLGHTDAASSLRYQTTDIETIRRAKEKANERYQPDSTKVQKSNVG